MNGIAAGPAATPPAGSIHWHAWLYTPLPLRPLTATLFSLESELRSIVAAAVDHGVSHLKLQWWKDEIDRLEGGQPRHPLTQALCRARPDVPHAWRPLHDAIAGLELELASASYESERELEAYFARAAGFSRTLALALDPAREPEPLERLGHALGKSVRMVEVIRDLRQNAVMGRVFVPLEWLVEHGISHVELRSRDGGEGARRCLARLAERSRVAWATATGELTQMADGNLRGLRVLGALHAALLERIARQGFAVGRRRIDLGPLDSLWTAWRSARQH
ncbi:MAG: squalene/phytoene synthase family protein [Steroidobacteraceae bacterium]